MFDLFEYHYHHYYRHHQHHHYRYRHHHFRSMCFAAQLQSIRHYRLSSIMCEQTASSRMQTNVFIRPLYGR